MTTQITAVFDERGRAEQALARLRRGGVEFSLAERADRSPGPDMPLVDMSPSYGLSMTDAVAAGEMYSAVLGSRAVRARLGTPPGQTRLTLNVRTDQVLRVREVIAGAKGRVL